MGYHPRPRALEATESHLCVCIIGVAHLCVPCNTIECWIGCSCSLDGDTQVVQRARLPGTCGFFCQLHNGEVPTPPGRQSDRNASSAVAVGPRNGKPSARHHAWASRPTYLPLHYTSTLPTTQIVFVPCGRPDTPLHPRSRRQAALFIRDFGGAGAGRVSHVHGHARR